MNGCVYLNYSFEGYDFSVIVDERGVRLGSCPGLKNFTIPEIERYSKALHKLNETVKGLSKLSKDTI